MAYSKKYMGHRELVLNLYPMSPLTVLVTITTEDNRNVTMDYKITGDIAKHRGLYRTFKEECEDLKGDVNLYATFYPDCYEPIIDVLERERKNIQMCYASGMEIVHDGRYDPDKIYKYNPNVLY